MMRYSKATAAALLAAGALTLGGCRTGSPGSSPSTVGSSETTAAPGTSTESATPAPTDTSSASTPADTPSAPTPAGAAPCRTADLNLSKGRTDGAMGSAYTPLIFTNVSSHPCTLTGFPGVSFTTSPNGDPIGAPAVRDTPKPTVTLGINEKASATLRITSAENYYERCKIVPVAGLRIYPPDNRDSLFLPWNEKACANADIDLLEISSVVPGDMGR